MEFVVMAVFLMVITGVVLLRLAHTYSESSDQEQQSDEILHLMYVPHVPGSDALRLQHLDEAWVEYPPSTGEVLLARLFNSRVADKLLE